MQVFLLDLLRIKDLLQIAYFGQKFAIIFRRAWRQAEKFYQISGSKSSIFVTILNTQQVYCLNFIWYNEFESYATTLRFFIALPAN
ncbi:MAG: hypothetical protein A3D44_02210 [Candidatus Staskawiczbacteria bacterium RIFCSPHIGHO2_02_FULL_42_22]|uniref:Uncharacterized protein n=1 Tax=Candidatus Staskawiczbacteria bacterium RIFCSPHIGHO2_02_FULL_42_22 TaxID=1802207 RepID=A0A1G2I291_9BACT|nr:MAG: hypothetical protein A3D44_02210 [Candidatus Staskawiczbacteria bacterium RIFCSPHIGHO2_02_FULL_42_22]